MTDNELLSAIANMMNKNNKTILRKIDTLEENLRAEIQRLDQKIDMVDQNLRAEIQKVDQNLRAEIQKVDQNLQAQIHKINLNLENNIELRLNHIEECYVSTYDRYKVETERLDKMQIDIEVMQDVIREHGQAIEMLTA